MKRILSSALCIIMFSMLILTCATNANASITTSVIVSYLQKDTSKWQSAAEKVLRDTSNLSEIGWDIGDVNGDRKLTRADVNDFNFNGVQDENEEAFTGQTTIEPWKGIYTLINPVDPTDDSAFKTLEKMLSDALWWDLTIIPDVDTNDQYTGGAKFDITSPKDPWRNPYQALYIPNNTKDMSGVFVLISGGMNEQIEASVKMYNGEVIISNQSDDTICTVAQTADIYFVSNIIISEIPEIEDFKHPKTEDEWYEHIVSYCMRTILERGNSPYNEVGIALCEIFGEDENIKYLTHDHITIVSDMLKQGGINNPQKFLNERFYKIQLNIEGEMLDVYLNVQPTNDQIKDISEHTPQPKTTTTIFIVGGVILAIGVGVAYMLSRKKKPNDEY